MEKIVIKSDVYTVEGDTAVLEISQRMGWQASRDLEGNILIMYPKEDQNLLDMLNWETESLSRLEVIEKSWA